MLKCFVDGHINDTKAYLKGNLCGLTTKEESETIVLAAFRQQKLRVSELQRLPDNRCLALVNAAVPLIW